MKVKSESEVTQSCPTLSNPMDCSLPGSSVHGIFQTRVLEWVAIAFSIVRKWKVKVKLLNRVGLVATPWTAAYQAPPSMGFSRQEHWSGSLVQDKNKIKYTHNMYTQEWLLRNNMGKIGNKFNI